MDVNDIFPMLAPPKDMDDRGKVINPGLLRLLRPHSGRFSGFHRQRGAENDRGHGGRKLSGGLAAILLALPLPQAG